MTIKLRNENKVQSRKKWEEAATKHEQLQHNAFLFPVGRSCICQYLGTNFLVPETV